MRKLPPLTADEGAAQTIKAGRPLRAHMEEKVDLHVHSTFSDGAKTPEELCRLAHKAGVAFLALCDHDTTAGQPAMQQACAAYPGMTLIPGTEVSTGEGGNVHVLGYGPRIFCDEMTGFLHSVASDRVQRARRMLDRLAGEGLCVPEDLRGALLSNPNVGRPHIARALVAMGAVNTVKQAFDRYLARGRCGYVPRSLPSTLEAIGMMKRLGVVPVLAHPMLAGLEWPALTALVGEMKQHGLMGLEAYHPSVNARDAKQLETLARSCGLLVTGGSDYHGDPSSTVHPGRLPAGWHSRFSDALALLEATHK